MESTLYTVGWIAPLPLEMTAAISVLENDKKHGTIHAGGYSYEGGKIGPHNVIMGVQSRIGTDAASDLAGRMKAAFPNIEFFVVVGIAGGVPRYGPPGAQSEIVLGDVVVSCPRGRFGGVVRYDFGAWEGEDRVRLASSGHTNSPPDRLQAAVNKLRSHRSAGNHSTVPNLLNGMRLRISMEERPEFEDPGPDHDGLFQDNVTHPSPDVDCQQCCDLSKRQLRHERGNKATRQTDMPKIHFGNIASSNQLQVSPAERNRLQKEHDVICFEMEGAGVIQRHPCLIVRGICDYCDSHKNKTWQPYAAATAAAYTRELLESMPASGFVESVLVNRISKKILPTERPETPPRPSLFVPFRRDPDFVDRGMLLHQVREKLSAPASRIALVGLGGVGKSQLAIEHCYRVAERSPETWVFWVHASNVARLEQGFRNIADIVKLAGRKDPQADVFKLVHDWLRDERKGKWLLVLDNADDLAVLSPASRCLPPSRHGSVIVTSRTERAISCLVEDGDIVPIKPMQTADAQALLYKKLGGKVGQDGMAELVVALECMPLALVQAAAYIKKRVPRYSVRQYLEEFHRNDKRKTSLLDYEAGSLRRDEEAKNSIIITWQISFDHIRDVRESAANLLSLMSFFDRQGIPEMLLHSYKERHIGRSSLEQESREREVNKRALEDDILILREYSFISLAATGEAFEIHSLVQLAMRKWLENQGQLERWKQQYVANLYEDFPPGEYENWERCQALFPHVAAVLEQKPESDKYLKKWARLLHNAAWFATETGRAGEAEIMCVLSMEVRTSLLGKEHMETLGSMALAGIVKNIKGQWKEAEALEARVLEVSSRLLGDEHPDTLTSMSNLAMTYSSQGRWKEAEELQVRVLETRNRVLGDEHPDTLNSMVNLASTYSSLDRWKEAEELEVRVIEMNSRVLGDDHPDTLTSMANLAVTYSSSRGRWKEAEELEVRVLERRKRVLGNEHPDTLTSMANLAVTYSASRDQLKEAEKLEVRVLETRKRVLGEEHPDTLTSMANLAFTLKRQGFQNKGITLMEKCFELRQQVLGAEHPDTISSREALQKWKFGKRAPREALQSSSKWRRMFRKLKIKS